MLEPASPPPQLAEAERLARRWRGLALLFLGTTLLAAGFAVWISTLHEVPATSGRPSPEVPATSETPPPPPPPPELRLEPAAFSDLPGWAEDRLGEAWPALLASCRVLGRQAASAPIGPEGVAGKAGDWQAFCGGAASLARADEASRRLYLESQLTPWQASDRGKTEGLLTGYYEPTLHGRLHRGGAFTTPLYLRPRDIVIADLGKFRPDLEGRKISGRLAGGELLPYWDRKAIDGGALARRGLELVWVDDPVDAFFLHIQGSGRVELPSGRVMRVGYAGQNGHTYVAVGKVLIEKGALTRETVSMQAIRRWLSEHPAEAAALLHENPSYVFFRRLSEPGPVGAQGVVLTPGRSLAVDRRFQALGVPLWLDGQHPDPDPTRPDCPLRRLVVAQDTGGAIEGPLRGDLFWGPGPEAAEIAGRMKHPARLWLLLPKGVMPAAESELTR